MKNIFENNKTAQTPTAAASALRWALVLAAAAFGGVVVSYYWRVFFDLDARGISPLLVTLGCAGFAAAVVPAAALLRALGKRGLAVQGAACVFLCGLLFVFANPPLQTPDETVHYLRTYAISMGRFDFDAERGYTPEVNRLMAAFPGAWVNAHTSAGLGTDPDTGAEQPYHTAGYALKQYGKGGAVQSVADSFAQYLDADSANAAHAEMDEVKEPINFLILPFLPGALGMLVARLLGFAALGCLYAGRIGNLLAYTALCYAALRSAARCKPLFLCVMLLPLSLFMGGSLSYDATLLGGYTLMLALLTKPRWGTRTAVVYLLSCIYVNGAKPYINLLWCLLPFIIPAAQWAAKGLRRWWVMGAAAGSLALTLFVEWYGTAMRHNYAAIARQGGETVAAGEQLVFILKNPLRYLAVLLGTLYENDGFLGQLGLFGWKDLPIAVLNLTGPLILLVAALLCTGKRDALGRRRTAWLGVFAAVYAVGCMTAMYITFTPVAMVRIVGLQSRYFMPVWLSMGICAAAVLRRFVTVTPQLAQPAAAQQTQNRVLALFGGYGAFGAVLLFQHYFIGPYVTIYQ